MVVSIFGKPKEHSGSGRLQPLEAETQPSKQRTVLSNGTVIRGKISSNDHLVIDGQIEGSITVKNTVTVGKNGQVQADVTATTLNVHGKIIGDVVATDRVAIEPTGSIEGNIHSPKLMINEGAHFRGNIDMTQKSAAVERPATEEKEKRFDLISDTSKRATQGRPPLN